MIEPKLDSPKNFKKLDFKQGKKLTKVKLFSAKRSDPILQVSKLKAFRPQLVIFNKKS